MFICHQWFIGPQKTNMVGKLKSLVSEIYYSEESVLLNLLQDLAVRKEFVCFFYQNKQDINNKPKRQVSEFSMDTRKTL